MSYRVAAVFKLRMDPVLKKPSDWAKHDEPVRHFTCGKLHQKSCAISKKFGHPFYKMTPRFVFMLRDRMRGNVIVFDAIFSILGFWRYDTTHRVTNVESRQPHTFALQVRALLRDLAGVGRPTWPRGDNVTAPTAKPTK